MAGRAAERGVSSATSWDVGAQLPGIPNLVPKRWMASTGRGIDPPWVVAMPEPERGYVVTAGAPVGKLSFIEALRHMRIPFAGDRPDHGTGIKLTTIDPHRAAEAAADVER
jgi:hypothetical protein